MPTLSDAIEAFGNDRRAKGHAAKTRANEQQVLRLLLADVGNINTRQLKPQHIDVFWANRSGWAPGTLNRARNTLNTFFSWCRARGYMNRDADPMAGTKQLKVPPRTRALIPQSEFQTVIGARDNPRTRVAFAIGLYTFARISEIEGLRWQDVDLEGGRLEIFRPKTTTRDTLPISSELEHELRRWKLEYAAHMHEQVRPEWYVIPGTTPPRGTSTKGAKGFTAHRPRFYLPTKRADLSKVIKQGLVDDGYYVPYEGGHTLRRSGATALYHQLSSVGHDRAIRICQAMLGHASVQTTELYLSLDVEKKQMGELLSGKPMFPTHSAATVVALNGREHGEEDRGDVRV